MLWFPIQQVWSKWHHVIDISAKQVIFSESLSLKWSILVFRSGWIPELVTDCRFNSVSTQTLVRLKLIQSTQLSNLRWKSNCELITSSRCITSPIFVCLWDSVLNVTGMDQRVIGSSSHLPELACTQAFHFELGPTTCNVGVPFFRLFSVRLVVKPLIIFATYFCTNGGYFWCGNCIE